NQSTFNGILRISGTNTWSNILFGTTSYTIPTTGGLWLNNANFTVTGQNGNPTNNGLIRVTSGTLNVDTATDNEMGAGAGTLFMIEGGTVNFGGRLNTANAVTYTQSGGTVNVTTVGNATNGTPGFGLSSASSAFNVSGGTINLVQANTKTNG